MSNAQKQHLLCFSWPKYNALVHSIHWSDPSTWPWIVWVWLAFLLAGWIKPAWKWFSRRQANSWPFISGRVESVNVEEPKEFFGLHGNSKPYYAEIRYSYQIEGNIYSGLKRREFDNSSDAWEFLCDLKDKSVEVQYRPGKPSSSSLPDSSLQALLQARSLAPPGASIGSGRMVPPWTKPYLLLLAVLSLVGLALSLFVHVQALRGREVPGGFWGLHVGIFVVWGPAVLVTIRRAGKSSRRRNLWKVVFKGTPAWVRYLFYAFEFYGLGSLLSYWAGKVSQTGTAGDDWQWFSGGWIGFYSAAFVILYAAATDAGLPGCVNGHSFPLDEPYCPLCGQAVITRS